MSTQTAVFKAVQEDKHLVFAEVYAPNRPDSDGEFMDAEGILKMSYDFMRAMKLDSVDSYHDNELVPGCCVVESFIARKGDKQFIEGSWVVGMHVDNEDMWDKIKKGEINGFSMEAMVNKTQVTVEMEIPPVVQGRTMKTEGDSAHDHTFHVAYNEDGKFLGGRTDVVNNHSHIIKRGSVTEVADEHAHRFSHLDDLILTEKA
jgi:hypothetical protein